MSHTITIAGDDVTLGDRTYANGETLVVTNAQFAALTSAGRFSDGTLTDGGLVGGDDEVFDQTTAPASTSTVAAGANPTKAEFDALRADFLALRTGLIGNGRPFA